MWITKALALLLFLNASAVSAADSPAELIAQGHYKRAEALLKPRLQTSPDDPSVNYLLSKVALAFGRLDEAVSLAEKALSADNNNVQYHAQLAEALGSKTGDPKAGMFQKLSLAKRMKQEAELALKLDPKNEDANSDLVGFYLDAPGIAGGSKQKAKELADHVTQLDPVQGYMLQCQIARHEKRTSEIEGLLKQASQAGPANYGAQISLANYYVNLEKPQLAQAQELARLALKIDPQRIGSYTILATVAAKESRWSDLDQVLSDSEKNIPDDLAPHYQAAKTILLSGGSQQLPRAESYFRKYLTQPPEAGTPTLAGAHWRLGLVLEKQGRKDEARTEVQSAVNLDPNLKPAQDDLKRLK